jgi:pre-rRNA-processing protein TSR4
MHDWKNGHKLFCSDLLSGKCGLNDLTYDPSYGVCLPEFVVVTEEEPAMVMEGQGEEKGEEERMREYHKYIQFGKYRDHSSKGGKQVKKVMEKAESGTTSDKVFKTFRRRVALEPEQVIRYQRGGHPLLVSQDNAPQTTDIPSCPCGADRQFEFQVMPQLLYYLKLDTVAEASVDWGTLLTYSCAASCDAHTADTCRYITDIVWKQDFSTVTK